MKVLAIVINIFIPDVSSFIVGKAGQGIGQIFIFGIGFLLCIVTLGLGAIIGFPMILAAWIWGLNYSDRRSVTADSGKYC